jgi:hypothetical protein
MKKISAIIVWAFVMAILPVQAQDNLWATGSAVPGGKQQLVKRPDGQFRFVGPLNSGEVKIRTTENYEKGVTRYLMPQYTDSYLINYGLRYSLTADSSKAGWQVLFQEDTYKFLVNTSEQTVTGELMLPWNEVLMGGSAYAGGSNNIEWNRDNMLPFVRDHEDPYVFSWTGELGFFEDVIEPGCFKLEGQMTWGPRELHPYTDNEDPLQTTQLRMGGPDRKWKITKAGTYRITVNLFYETMHAELLNAGNGGGATAITEARNAEKGSQKTGIVDLQGRRQQRLQRGLNIVRKSDGTVRKVYVDR